MHPTEIESILRAALALDELIVQGENGHFQVTAVAPLFAGMNRVKKQQTIYAPLMDHIASNAIHALSIKAFTPEEWERHRKLNGF